MRVLVTDAEYSSLDLEAGVLAGFIGAPLSVVIGGLGSLITAAIAAVKSKNLMKFEM